MLLHLGKITWSITVLLVSHCELLYTWSSVTVIYVTVKPVRALSSP